MPFFKRIFRGRQKAQVKKAKERQKPKKPAEQKPVVSEVRLLAEGAVDHHAFVKACKRRGIEGNERIIELFEQLYKWYSQNPVLSALEAEMELEAKIENKTFDEVVVWADIMMANKLRPGKKIFIPRQYVEAYHRIAGKKRKKQ